MNLKNIKVLDSNWFECRASYDKTLENGLQKKVTETYIVDACSFTEAEANLSDYLSGFGEFRITTEAFSKIAEILLSDNLDDDKYYLAVLNFVSLNEKTGKEMKTKHSILVQAVDIDKARSYVVNYMLDSVQDYTIHSLKETQVIDVVLRKKAEP